MATHAARGWRPIIAALVIYTLVAAVLGTFAAFLFIYSGVFNVAATVKDSPPLRWVLVATREASVRRHARGIQAPAPSRWKKAFASSGSNARCAIRRPAPNRR